MSKVIRRLTVLMCASLLASVPTAAIESTAMAGGPLNGGKQPKVSDAKVSLPSITNVASNVGPTKGGTRVTITGTGFTKVKSVKFGAAAGTAVKVTSSTKLSVTTPKHAAGTVNVQVRASGGTSKSVSKDRFTYQDWSPSKLPLPAGAASDAQPTVEQMTCWSATKCAGAGTYTAASGDSLEVLWRLSSKKWTAVKAPMPKNAADNPNPQAAGIACTAKGACVVWGSYTYHANGSDSLSHNLVWSLTGSTWAGRNLPLPSDASDLAASAQVQYASCATGAVCAAAGEYRGLDNGVTDYNAAVLWTWSAGTWHTVKAPLPADSQHLFSPSFQGLSCGASTQCAAVGLYDGTTAFGTYAVALWTLKNGLWTATKGQSPAGYSASIDIATQPISCGATGLCLARVFMEGQHLDSVFATYAEINGTWGLAALPLPAGAASDLDPTVDGVSCQAKICAAVGHYLDSAGNTQGVLWRLTGGVWHATRAALPPDASDNPNVRLASVVCSADGSCIATGTYTYHQFGTDQNIDTLAWKLSGTAWSRAKPPLAANPVALSIISTSCTPTLCAARGSYVSTSLGYNLPALWAYTKNAWTGTKTTLPTGAQADPSNGWVYGLSCGASGGCVAWGNYTDTMYVQRAIAWTYTG